MIQIPGASGAAGGSRRPRPLLLGLATVVLLAVVLAWMRYDPVVGGEATWCPEPSTMVPGGPDDPLTGQPSIVCSVANTDEASVSFAATVRNAGFLPVVVREVRMRGEIEGVLRVDDVRMSLRGRGVDVSPYELVRFAPFRLAPGEQRLVEVSGTLSPCEEIGRARVATFRSLPLRTTVFGLPHDSDAALTPPVRLIAESC